jgi:adenosine deaminase
MTSDLATFVRGLPKAELHLHLEGTLEPRMMFEMAERNRVSLPFRSPGEVEAAYEFANLQEFLDLYYLGCRVLVEPQDFYDLAYAYFARCRDENILHAEVFFDPQGHTARGVPIRHVFDGFFAAAREAELQFGLSVGFIMCFLRHLDAREGFELLRDAAPYLGRLTAVGLDSSERDHPPKKYASVFDQARRLGLPTVAHAGEEGPPQYVWDSLRLLGASRIDHGVRAIEDPALLAHLVAHQVPLTVCPLSNIKLRVFPSMAAHSIAALYRAGVKVTINSDDPAYFGGYLSDNYLAVAETFDLGREDLYRIARNSFEASFLPAARKQLLLGQLDQLWRSGAVTSP